MRKVYYPQKKKPDPLLKIGLKRETLAYTDKNIDPNLNFLNRFLYDEERKNLENKDSDNKMNQLKNKEKKIETHLLNKENKINEEIRLNESENEIEKKFENKETEILQNKNTLENKVDNLIKKEHKLDNINNKSEKRKINNYRLKMILNNQKIKK